MRSSPIKLMLLANEDSLLNVLYVNSLVQTIIKHNALQYQCADCQSWVITSAVKHPKTCYAFM